MKDNLITRTFSFSKVNVLKVDIETRTVKEDNLIIDGKYDTADKVEKYIRKNDTTVVSVLSVENIDDLRGMTEQEFIANGTFYSERSKENRGMISKVVKLDSTNVMAVDKERNVIDTVLAGKLSEKKARKVCEENGLSFVRINHIESSEQLVCMSPDDFYKLSKPMNDRFHIA